MGRPEITPITPDERSRDVQAVTHTLLAVLAASGLVYAQAPPPPAPPAPPPGTWSEKARLGEMRTEPAVVFLNGKLYVLGGMARGQDSHALVQEYDPATDRWRELAPMPGPLSHPGAVGLNGKIYVVGGFLRNVHLDAQPSVFEFDPAANSWQTRAPLKSPRGAVGLTVLNGKIHAVGGRDVNRVTLANHEVYDPTSNTWSELAPLPRARDHLAIATLNGRIHVIGGRYVSPAEKSGFHDVYDPATNAWKPAEPLLTPRSGGASAGVQGPHPRHRWRMQHRQAVHRERGLRSEDRPMVYPRAHAIGTPRHPGGDRRPGGVCPGGAPQCATAASETLLTFTLP